MTNKSTNPADDLLTVHIQLPSGGTATVSRTARPETIAALDGLLRAAAEQIARDPGCVSKISFECAWERCKATLQRQVTGLSEKPLKTICEKCGCWLLVREKGADSFEVTLLPDNP